MSARFQLFRDNVGDPTIRDNETGLVYMWYAWHVSVEEAADLARRANAKNDARVIDAIGFGFGGALPEDAAPYVEVDLTVAEPPAAALDGKGLYLDDLKVDAEASGFIGPEATK